MLYYFAPQGQRWSSIRHGKLPGDGRGNQQHPLPRHPTTPTQPDHTLQVLQQHLDLHRLQGET